MPCEIVAERFEKVREIRRRNIPESMINSQTVQQNDRWAGSAPVDLYLGKSSWIDHRASLKRQETAFAGSRCRPISLMARRRTAQH
jgi:hypothetical protein